MNTCTYTEAHQKLAALLDQAAEYGEVRIRRRDGWVFVSGRSSAAAHPWTCRTWLWSSAARRLWKAFAKGGAWLELIGDQR